MHLPLTLIHLARIDWEDRAFIVSCGFQLEALKASIQTLGLLSPPLLRLREDGGYQMICGYQRLLALQQLQQDECPALVAPAATSDTWALQASLQDNALGRGFNPLEAANMIHRLLRHFPEQIIISQHLPLLGLPSSRSQLRLFAALLDLEPPWQELAARRRLTPPAAATLSQWTAVDREALLPWFQMAPLSHSKQLECLEYLTTLSRREGQPPSHWLAQPELETRLQSPVLAGPEKIKHFLAQLRQWCFPRASQAQEQFQQHLKALEIYQHPHLRLTPPPAFEDADFRLELRFRNTTDLSRRLQQAQDLLTRPELDALTQL